MRLLLCLALSAIPLASADAATFELHEAVEGCPDGVGPCWDVLHIEASVGDELTLVHVGRPEGDGMPHALRVFAPVDQAERVALRGPNESGEPIRFVLEEAREIEFFCEVHPSTMHGTILASVGEEPPRAYTLADLPPSPSPTPTPATTSPEPTHSGRPAPSASWWSVLGVVALAAFAARARRA